MMLDIHDAEVVAHDLVEAFASGSTVRAYRAVARVVPNVNLYDVRAYLKALPPLEGAHRGRQINLLVTRLWDGSLPVVLANAGAARRRYAQIVNQLS